MVINAATALRAVPFRVPASAAVVGDPDSRNEAVRRLLTEGGIKVCDEPVPDGLVIVIGQGREDERLRTIRSLVDSPNAGILAVVPADVPNAGLRRVLIAGAGGIVVDRDIERALVPAARAVLAGQLTVPTVLGQQIAPRPLSHREKQILGLVVLGMTNREIAGELYLAESTVKTHLSSAFRKIDARSRSEAVARIHDPEFGLGVGVLAAVNGADG